MVTSRPIIGDIAPHEIIGVYVPVPPPGEVYAYVTYLERESSGQLTQRRPR